jgi:hypothetical protein
MMGKIGTIAVYHPSSKEFVTYGYQFAMHGSLSKCPWSAHCVRSIAHSAKRRAKEP